SLSKNAPKPTSDQPTERFYKCENIAHQPKNCRAIGETYKFRSKLGYIVRICSNKLKWQCISSS
ncbi:hypothetical protein J6590_104079, partial [Homalodisca vitripennis]